MQDAIAGFESAPLWAQIGMVFFAVTAAVMLLGPSVRKRRFRRQFDAIARGLGLEPPTGGDWPFTCPIKVGKRDFEVTYDFRGGKRSGLYRGPHGYLLTTATRLTGTRWPMHQVDFSTVDTRLAWLVRGKRATGDPEFDARVIVVEDGLPVRDGWLDAATRTAIARFLDDAPLKGVVWVREGELRYIMQDPWTGIDGQVIRALLERQATLATALERTAALHS